MVSSIVRSAGSCVLPAVAGPRRLGGGRLPLAAGPGHHRAGLLGGWSVGTSAGIDSLRPGKLVSTGASPWALKAAGRSPSGAPRYEEEGDSELVRMFKVALMTSPLFIVEPSPIQLPEPHYQILIGEVIERSFALWVEVANRLRPPADTKIYEGLHRSGDLIVCAKVRKSVVSWKRAGDLAEGLELLRRVLSSALQAPLPLTLTAYYEKLPVEYDNKEAFSLMLQYTFDTVEKDIRSMFDDERTRN